ncbi:MAG: hypothetical protein JXR37_36450 [Kiritimatiellae bacterium]|nr:hypothetical protein [Kiritimatiellia bacterium]
MTARRCGRILSAVKRETGIRIFAVVWFAFSMVLMSITTGDLQRLMQVLRSLFSGHAE